MKGTVFFHGKIWRSSENLTSVRCLQRAGTQRLSSSVGRPGGNWLEINIILWEFRSRNIETLVGTAGGHSNAPIAPIAPSDALELLCWFLAIVVLWQNHHHHHHHNHHHEHHQHDQDEDLPSPPLIREQGSSQAWLADSPSHLVTFILVMTMNIE